MHTKCLLIWMNYHLGEIFFFERTFLHQARKSLEFFRVDYRSHLSGHRDGVQTLFPQTVFETHGGSDHV